MKLKSFQRRPHRMPLSRPLVLLVECHDETRALYAIALSAMGFDVVPAVDTDDAYDRAWLTRPDIIVTGVPVSGVDGENFIEDVRCDPRLHEIPIVVLAGQDELSGFQDAARECCSAVITKPCRADQLALTLRDILSRDERPAHASLRR